MSKTGGKKEPMSFVDQQRAIHKAALAGAQVDDAVSPQLAEKLDKLSEGIYQAAKYQFDFGEPEQAQHLMSTMNSFMEVLNVMLVERNKGKK